MNIEIISALCAFAFVSSITPGPNNLMLMTSGANFGVRRTMPHFLGVVLGFLLMILLVGAGLVRVFEAYPVSHEILRFFSIGYLVYLAWKIALAKPGTGASAGAPLSALQAALFQWVNPKAWAMALTALTVYAPSPGFATVMLVALLCALVNTPSVFVWVLLGSRLRTLLQDPLRLRIFNYVMALLLLATLYPVLAS
jgi:threonine/homoserine/homoserine lactone efflux protein